MSLGSHAIRGIAKEHMIPVIIIQKHASEETSGGFRTHVSHEAYKHRFYRENWHAKQDAAQVSETHVHTHTLMSS